MVVLLKDVARHAGFSIATVSKVLNNVKTEVKVSESTKKKIKEAAKELGYKPNYIARSLRMKRTSTIGVIGRASNDVPRQLKFAEEYASKKGYELLMALVRSMEEKDECEIERLMHRGIDGLLILSPSLDEENTRVLEKLSRGGFPIVGFGPTLAETFDFVDWDRTLAFERLATHLLEQGCEKLCFIGKTETPGLLQRLEGIKQALSNYPDGTLKRIEVIKSRYDRIPKVLEEEFRKERPHGVLCQSDELALAAMTAAKRMGLRIPIDIAITGNSNSKWGRMLDIPLTSIEMPLRQMTGVAITHIIKRVEHKGRRYEPLKKHFEAKIIFRKSSRGFGVTK